MPDTDHFIKSIFLIILSICLSESYSQGFDAELVEQKTEIEVTGKHLTSKYSYIIQINNRSGDKFSEISIPYSKSNKVSDIEASVYDNFGRQVRKIKKSEIIDKSQSSDISFYTDNFVKEFTLRHNNYPYSIKYSYQQESDQFIDIEYWCPIIDSEIPTLSASLFLSTPLDYHIYYRSNLEDKCTIDTTEKNILYKWVASYKKPIKEEIFMPSENEFLPIVKIVPEMFTYFSSGSNKSWETYGNWTLELLNGKNDLPLSEQQTILNLVDGISDKKEQIRLIYHYLQDETRYLSISIKTGGHVPYPASYVTKNKYGDCKALANYFISCLSTIHLDAFYTLINSDKVIDTIDQDFPSPHFNHAIVYIPLEKDTLWVDCTSKLAFGYLGTSTQNRPALVVMRNASKLIDTPTLSADDIRENRTIHFDLRTNENKASFNNTYKGNKYEILKYISQELSETERMKYIRYKMLEPGFETQSYDINKPERDIPELNLTYNSTTEQLIKEYGNESLLKIIPVGLPYFEEPKNRKLPLQINYPINKTDSITYVLPENYNFIMNENFEKSSKYGSYNIEYKSIGNNSIMVFRKFLLNPGKVTLMDYRDFYKFIAEISEIDKSSYLTLIKK